MWTDALYINVSVCLGESMGYCARRKNTFWPLSASEKMLFNSQRRLASRYNQSWFHQLNLCEYCWVSLGSWRTCTSRRQPSPMDRDWIWTFLACPKLLTMLPDATKWWNCLVVRVMEDIVGPVCAVVMLGFPGPYHGSLPVPRLLQCSYSPNSARLSLPAEALTTIDVARKSGQKYFNKQMSWREI